MSVDKSPLDVPGDQDGQQDRPQIQWWICSDCLAVFVGDDHAAAKHFDQAECSSHWIYEVVTTFEGRLMSWNLTGREIHTSDFGGYYLGKPQPISEAWERFGRSLIVSMVRDKMPRLV